MDCRWVVLCSMVCLLLRTIESLQPKDTQTPGKTRSTIDEQKTQCSGLRKIQVEIDTQPGDFIFSSFGCSQNRTEQTESGIRYTITDKQGYFSINENTGNVYLKSSMESVNNKTKLTFVVRQLDQERLLSTVLVVVTVTGTIQWQISLTIDGSLSGVLQNGTNVDVFCRLSNVVKKPAIRWSLSNKLVTTVKGSRLEAKTLQKGIYWLGVFSFRPILMRDTGQFMCTLSGFDVKSHKRARQLTVVTAPRVTVKPEVVYFRKGQEVNLACSKQPNNSMINGNIRWVKKERAEKSLIVAESTGFYLDYTLTNVTMNTTYYCEWRHKMETFFSKDVVVKVFPEDTLTCPNITDDRGVVWPETPTGQVAKSKCPDKYKGTTTRGCNSTGSWTAVDYDSGCRNKSLEEFVKILQNIEDGYPEDDLSGKLSAILPLNTDQLTALDIDLLLGYLEKISRTYNRTQDEKSLLEACLDVANAILKADGTKWRKLKEMDLRGPNSMLMSVDDLVAQTMASMANTASDTSYNMTYVTDEIFLQIRSVNEEDINFPSANVLPAWISERTTSVQMLKQSFPNVPNGTHVWYSGVIYRNIESKINKRDIEDMDTKKGMSKISGSIIVAGDAQMPSKPDVVSRVVSFHVYPQAVRLSPPLYIKMHVNRTNSEALCSFLNYTSSDRSDMKWSSNGCYEVDREDDVVRCGCNHTTNFAILMSPVQPGGKDAFILGIISMIGIAISLFFLLLTIIVYCMLWKYLVKSQVARIKSVLLMHLCVLLIISYTLFLVGVTLTENKDVCIVFAALLHYSFLAVFFVMLAEGVHLFISIVVVISFTSYLKSLLIMVWVTPALVVGVTLGVVKPEGYTGQRYCWLSTERSILWAFVAPVLIIIAVNFVILVVALRKMFRRKRMKMLNEDNIKHGKYIARALGVILPIIGVTWVFGVFAVNIDVIVFQYIFAVANTLQGVFIFVFHCCTSNVRVAYKEMKTRKKRDSISNSTMQAVNATRSNNSYVLGLSTNALRNNESEQECSRVIALPIMYDRFPDIQKQQLIRDDGNGEPGISSQFVNIGFSDNEGGHASIGSSRGRINHGDTEGSGGSEKNKRHIGCLAYVEEDEDELQKKLKKQRKAIEKVYNVCNAFEGPRHNIRPEVNYQSTNSSRARDRWREAFEAIQSAKSYHVSPTSTMSYYISPPSTPESGQPTMPYHVSPPSSPGTIQPPPSYHVSPPSSPNSRKCVYRL